MHWISAGVLMLALAFSLEPQPGPGPRSGHSLVYDPASRRLVLAGGYTPPHDATPASLWTWDGRQWEAVKGSDTGPAKTIVGAAAIDTARRRLVSFGGSNSVRGTLGDTWEWDGVRWQELSDTAIGRRDHHVMAYDPSRSLTVLFGGNAGPAPWPSDTWGWDGRSWTRLAAEGPIGRSRAAMVYDSARREMVLFGGAGAPAAPRDPLVILGDTWVWNGSSWREVPGQAPAPRYAHAMAFDSRRGITYMYGGATMNTERQTVHYEDMWSWDGQRWTAITMNGPTPGKRYSPAMAFDAARNRIVLHGGFEVRGRGSLTTFDDVWEWDGSSWTKVK